MANSSDSIEEQDNSHDERLESVIADYIRASEADGLPDRRTLLHQFPELAAELKHFFAQRDRLKRLTDPIREFGDDLYQAIGPGKQLSYVGNYELLEEVARGGMGVVYKARQTTLGRIVAVKMIVAGRLANEQDVQRFQAEAQAAASLKHPNIVSIHEVGQHEGWHYFSMDYVEGHDLSTALRLNLLPAKTAATYVRQMAEAIHCAHQQGILHRDLKPSNILIDQQDQVHITDFGLAMRVEGDQGLTQTGQILGTPSYMPPEQAQGKRGLIGPASDVYALGAILYECLTGRPPFRAESVVATIEQVIHAEAASPRTLNTAIPRDLETICLKCLEKEPHRRYCTGQLLAEDLGRYLRGEPILARPARVLERNVKWVRRHPMAAALLVASLVALLSVMGMGIGVYYNAQLDSANLQLRSSNQQLEAARDTLESNNQQLSLTSAQLERSVDEVKAERALARRHLYASRMALIQVAEQKSDTARIVQLLRSVIPESDQQEDLREFEWYYLWRKHHGEESRLVSQTSPVTSLALSPDGKWIATAGLEDPLIKIWDTENGRQLCLLSGHSNGITDLAFGRNSKRLVSASLDMTLKLWDIENAKTEFTISGFDTASNAIEFREDERQIVTGDSSGTVCFWDATTGRKLEVWKISSDRITDLGFLKPGNSLAIGFASEWGIHLLTEGISNQPNKSLRSTTNIALDSTGQRVASGFVSKDRKSSTVSVLDVESESSIWGISDSKLIRRLALSEDGNLVAVAWDNQTIEIWTTAKEESISTFHTGDTVRSLAFSQAGDRVYAGTEGGEVLIWSLPGKEVATLESGTRAYWTTFVNNAQLLVPSSGVASIWEIKTGRQRSLDLTSVAGLYRWTASAGENHVVGLRGRELIDIETGKTRVTLQDCSKRGSFGYMGQIAIDKDCRRVAGAFASSSVDLWDAATGELRRRFDVPAMAVSVALSPNGEFLASGTAWHTSLGSGRNEEKQSAKDLLEICFLQVWEVNTGRKVFYREEIFAGGIWDLAFSPDGKYLAAAMGRYPDTDMSSGRIQIWDLANWHLALDLRGHTGSVWSVAFNESSTRLATSSGDWTGKGIGQAKVWDVITGSELLTFAEGKNPVFDIAFSPDSLRLATANLDGKIRLWNGTIPLQSPTYQLLQAD